jgi:hypothetical protein
MLRYNSFQTLIVNKYVDLSDMTNSPVKAFIDDNQFWPIDPNIQKQSILYLRKATATLKDNIWPLGEPEKEINFHEFKSNKDLFMAIDFYPWNPAYLRI